MPKQANEKSGQTVPESNGRLAKKKRRSTAAGAHVPKPDTMREADVANGENPET
jgi:hypothetical protein